MNQINNVNNANIAYLINAKKGHLPTWGTSQPAVMTDFDVFPYPRYFRGNPSSDEPIVAEREAGYRPRYDRCYTVNENPSNVPRPKPDFCFEGPCSVVFPCYTENVRSLASKAFLNVELNRANVIEYR